MKSRIEAAKKVVSSYGIPASKVLGVLSLGLLVLVDTFVGSWETWAGLGLVGLGGASVLLFHYASRWSVVRVCHRCGIDQTRDYRHCPKCAAQMRVESSAVCPKCSSSDGEVRHTGVGHE